MHVSTESIVLLDQADMLAKMILRSEIAEHYRRSLYKLEQDKEAQRIIEQFKKTKDLYEDVMRFGKYHPDYKVISKNMREIKRELDLNERVAEFKKAERGLQQLLDEISMYIGRSVSEHIKVPTGNPYFDATPCGSGCGSGGSCGCKAS
ncbi:YlbF family regulator [Bacillus sp. FJAT-47783]|uniref:YlbF family regulator n=1 Tax=Bacillus sp. FJAT-47783 TaxID=2922712 RepID=UPI001FABC2C4|nr:YlbF family regulator [Bacillus sp. FJAT-47783]